MTLSIRPCTLKQANDFVREMHRHHKPTVGHKFSIALYDDERMVGVVIVGRPVARRFDDGLTAEVNRCCTDGTANACSMLYGAARRAAAAMGYKRLITYTLPDEGGASLRGAGWRHVGLAGGGNWNVPSRPRQDTIETLSVKKWLWEAA
jgi:hypothetical protein